MKRTPSGTLTFGVRLTDDLAAKLGRISDAIGLNESVTVRLLIEDFNEQAPPASVLESARLLRNVRGWAGR